MKKADQAEEIARRPSVSRKKDAFLQTQEVSMHR
jgi:hypothetical protein